MPFGIGDILGFLGGAGFLANKAVGEHRKRTAELTRNEMIQKFVKKYSDPILEERLRQDIQNPDKFNEIWERIESYKAQGGGWYRWNRDHAAWQEVGSNRLPFRTESGNLHAHTQYEDTVLESNRNKALFMLMHTYGKMTIKDATMEARNASEAMLRNWIVKHPAEY